MSTVLVGPELATLPKVGGGGNDATGLRSDGDGGGGNGSTLGHDLYRTGVWVLMIPVAMLFLGLTSSMVVRKGISDDWIPLQIPAILWLNTCILLGSSVSFEMARRAAKDALELALRKWIYVTAALGLLFLLGQIAAWKQLVAQGVFVSTNPSSSFFYVLTASHSAHLAGGLAVLIYLTIRMLRGEFGPRRRSALGAAAIYWHFMDALWIYLFLLLIFWR